MTIYTQNHHAWPLSHSVITTALHVFSSTRLCFSRVGSCILFVVFYTRHTVGAEYLLIYGSIRNARTQNTASLSCVLVNAGKSSCGWVAQRAWLYRQSLSLPVVCDFASLRWQTSELSHCTREGQNKGLETEGACLWSHNLR